MDDKTDGMQLILILVLHGSNKHWLNNADLSLHNTYSSICIYLSDWTFNNTQHRPLF